MKRILGMWVFLSGLALSGLGGCAAINDQIGLLAPYEDAGESGPIALVNGAIIDGTGSAAILDGALIVEDGTIAAVGSEADVSIPEGCRVIDVEGATILPGLVNAHVHNAFYEQHAELFAASGVTTVRDLSCDLGQVGNAIAFRDRARANPIYSRILSAGTLITVPFGYMAINGIAVWSEADARDRVLEEIDAGVDFVKIVFQEPVFPQLNNLSPELGAFIVSLAHSRGVPVTAHVGTTRDLKMALDCGVDDIAHITSDPLTDELISRMVGMGIYVEPTLTDWGTSTGSERATILSNFTRFVDAGGRIALGAEHIHTVKNGGAFVGVPIAELEMMKEGGMTPMQIITASTVNAARVCGLDSVLGTLEVGKRADVLVLNGDPLADLESFSQVRMVIHDGAVIKE